MTPPAQFQSSVIEAFALRRKVQQLSYQALADKSGVDVSTVFHVLTGKTKAPTLATLVKIAEALRLHFELRFWL